MPVSASAPLPPLPGGLDEVVSRQGSLPIGKSVPVTVKVGGRRFKTRGWSFSSGAGVMLPERLVRDMGLQAGQMVDLELVD